MTASAIRRGLGALQFYGMTAAFAAPSFFFNVVPHAKEWLAAGFLASGPAGTTIAQFMCLIALMILSVGIARAPWIGKILLSVFGAMLIIANFISIMDGTHAERGDSTRSARTVIARAAALDARIAELRKDHAALPQFAATSEEQVEAGRRAVTAAEKARDLECLSGVGTQCRARQVQLATVQSSLLALTAQRTPTVMAEAIDAELAQKTQARADLGPLPQYADATSGFIEEQAGLPSGFIAKWRAPFAAIMSELLNLFGGFLTRLCMGTPEIAKDIGVRVERLPRIFPAPPVTRKPAILLESPAKTKRPGRKTAEIAKTELAGVRAWADACVTSPKGGTRRKGGSIYAILCYKHYCEWCADAKVEPVTLTAFGRIVKGDDIKIKSIRKGGRVLYTGIVLKGKDAPVRAAPKLRVVAA